MTGAQSNAAAQRPLRVPTAEELPPLVQRSTLGIIDEALTFLRVQPGLLLGVAVAVLLPLRLLALAAPGAALRDTRTDQLIDIFIRNVDQPAPVAAALATIVLESIALLTIATIYGQLIASWYSGSAVPIRKLLSDAMKRFHGVVAAWLICKALILLAGGLTFGLVGVFAAVVGPLLGAERLSAARAVRRSFTLVATRPGKAVYVYIVSGVGGLIIRLVIDFAPAYIADFLRVPQWLSAGVLDFVGSVAAIAFTAAVSVILYLDLRVRSEGIDLVMGIDRAFPSSVPSDRVRGGRG